MLSAGERLHRARRLGTAFGRTYLGIRTERFIERHLRPPDMDSRWSARHRSNAETIYATAVELRGLILKGCQFLGARADVLPPEYVEVLSRLQDRVPPKPFPVVQRRVERELGVKLEDAFRHFEPTPIASASLAQVHRATRHDGRDVAVKVQYPEIETLVHSDLSNLRVLFRAVSALERDFDPMPIVEELANTVPEELDFVNEGRNAERISGFFAGRPDLGVPAVHWDLTSERVLVMDHVAGIKVDDLAALRAAGIDPDRVAELLVEAYCEQFFVHGFFHADPHPGNLLVQQTASGPRLVFLDFGLAKELPPHFREGVLAFATGLLLGQPEAMADAMQDLGFETRGGSRAGLLGFARFVLESAKRVRARAHVDRELVETLRRELPGRIRRDPIVRVPSHLVLAGRVLGLLSGLTRALETRVDLVQKILPYAVRSGPSRSG